MKKQKTSKEKRILVASLLIAAVISVGGTFAWFTSKDEVTNRLTAQANYGVRITETFTPPDDWTPGQEVNKDVAAVNTGNVSAFVKLTVSNKINLILAKDVTLNAGTYPSATYDNDYVTLRTGSATDDTIPDEVKAAQAGEYLVYTTAKDNDNKLIGTGNYNTESKPTYSGIYVFRRDIDYTTNPTTNKTTIELF